MAGSSEPKKTSLMIAVNQSSMKGYPHASISSKGAFEWTLNKIIRSNTSGFKLLFLHVQVPDKDDFKNLTRKEVKTGLPLLEYFVRRCHEMGIACESWIKWGGPREVICREVKRVQPDLLVVGSRGLGTFQKIFVGSVSEYCAKHAECPVITIKRTAEESPEDLADD